MTGAAAIAAAIAAPLRQAARGRPARAEAAEAEAEASEAEAGAEEEDGEDEEESGGGDNDPGNAMLRAIEGVADVNSNGGLERQFVIEPDLKKLTTAGITPSELAQAVGANVANAGGGTITIDDKAHKIGPGTTVYMPANAKVTYQNGPDEIVAIQVFAGPEPAAKYDGWKTVKP